MSKAPAVDYALRIIEYFSESQKEIGLADICNSLEINKNAASRVLESLLEYNWIYLSDSVRKKYRFTMKPFSVVSKCTPGHALAELAKNKKCDENVTFTDEMQDKETKNTMNAPETFKNQPSFWQDFL